MAVMDIPAYKYWYDLTHANDSKVNCQTSA